MGCSGLKELGHRDPTTYEYKVNFLLQIPDKRNQTNVRYDTTF